MPPDCLTWEPLPRMACGCSEKRSKKSELSVLLYIALYANMYVENRLKYQKIPAIKPSVPKKTVREDCVEVFFWFFRDIF